MHTARPASRMAAERWRGTCAGLPASNNCAVRKFSMLLSIGVCRCSNLTLIRRSENSRLTAAKHSRTQRLSDGSNAADLNTAASNVSESNTAASNAGSNAVGPNAAESNTALANSIEAPFERCLQRYL